jgi:hypothetical protein
VHYSRHRQAQGEGPRGSRHDRRQVLRGSEGPEHGPRLKGAQEALDLYHKLPPPADDHDVVVAALDQISHDLQEIAQKVTALA